MQIPLVKVQQVEHVQRQCCITVACNNICRKFRVRQTRLANAHQNAINESVLCSKSLQLANNSRGELRDVFSVAAAKLNAFAFLLTEHTQTGQRRFVEPLIAVQHSSVISSRFHEFAFPRERRSLRCVNIDRKNRFIFGSRIAVFAFEQQPSGLFILQLHHVPFATQAATVKHNLQFAISDLLRTIDIVQQAKRALVPNRHRPRAVVAGRDHSVKVFVLNRVVFRLNRKVLLLRIMREPLRHGPRFQYTFHLKPQVVMQVPRVVSMDYENRFVAAILLRLSRSGLRRLIEVTLLVVWI